MEQITTLLSGSLYFGLVLSLLVYIGAVALNRRLNWAITTPLLTTTIGIIALLLIFNIPHETYFHGARYLLYFLVPATVCFAVPMYKQMSQLGRYKWAVLISIIVGCAASVGSVALWSYAFGLEDVLRNSMVAVSVTTAIAIGITEELGGIVGIIVFVVIITGILGNAIGRQACEFFRFRNPISEGLAIGNSSHAMGTVKALEMGEKQGAASSLAIVISGVATAILAPIILWLFS